MSMPQILTINFTAKHTIPFTQLLTYQQLIFGTVLIKIVSQGLALSYIIYIMKINLNYAYVLVN